MNVTPIHICAYINTLPPLVQTTQPYTFYPVLKPPLPQPPPLSIVKQVTSTHMHTYILHYVNHICPCTTTTPIQVN